jgi:hypothetical protein
VSGKRRFEEQIASLELIGELPPEECIEPLRKALGHRNNFTVGKAADLIRKLRVTELTPELLSAFDRFFEDALKSDPQCWAKNGIARALAEFEHQDAAVFLRGMRHVQPEPSYGGASDSAGTLRAICALALVQCRSLKDAELLAHLVDLLADKEKSVRAEAIRAIELVGSASSALLLRERAVLGSDEPEVLGACYGGILRLEGVGAIAWVSRFFASGDDSAAEAALAVAGTHSSEGFEILCKHFDRVTSSACPNFSRRSTSVSAKMWRCSIWPSRFPARQPKRLGDLARELKVTIIASLFERRAPGLYHNTAAILDTGGKVAGIYRKMHIPDDPLYYEKFYFTPGDLGFRRFELISESSARWFAGTSGIPRARG